MKNLLIPLLIVFSVPVWATDGTPINESRALNADGRLMVINVAGLIDVKAWNKNEVRITGTLGEGSEKLEISGGPAELRVEVKLPRRSSDVEGTQLYLRVPEGTAVELKGVSADVVLTGTRGPALLSSVSGDVTVDAAMRELRAQTVSGDLRIKAPSADTRLEAVSGDINAERLTGRLKLETVSGDIVASGGGFSEVDIETVSGDVEMRIDALADGAEINGDSVSGDLELVLPKNLDATIVLESFSGRLRSDFGKPEREPRGHHDEWRATAGNGKGSIRIDSHSGNVTLKSR